MPGYRGQACRIEAETHRAALVLDLPLVRHEVDHRGGGEQVELGRVGIRGTHDVARKLDHPALQAQAQAQVRHTVLASVACSEHLALDATMAEPSWDEDAGHAGERRANRVGRERLRVDPAHHDRAVMCPAGVPERLGHREVRVGQLDVLADDRDLQFLLRPADPVDERPPGGQVGRMRAILQGKAADDQVAEALASNCSGTS